MAKIKLSGSNGNYDAEFLGEGSGFRTRSIGFFGKLYSGGLSLLKHYRQRGRGKINPKKLRYFIPEESVEASVVANLQRKQINLDMLNDHPGDPKYVQQIADEINRSLRELKAGSPASLSSLGDSSAR